MVPMGFSIYLELFGHARIGNFKNCIGMFSVILEIYSPDGTKTIRKKEKVKDQIKVHNIKEQINRKL